MNPDKALLTDDYRGAVRTSEGLNAECEEGPKGPDDALRTSATTIENARQRKREELAIDAATR